MKLARALPWLGVVAAALLLVNVNVLGARWYKRWDFTSDKLYSLSQPTRELLTGLQRPVDVSVLQRQELRRAPIGIDVGDAQLARHGAVRL